MEIKKMSKHLKYDDLIAQTVFPVISTKRELLKDLGQGIKIPPYIAQNLANVLRPYQREALENLILVNNPLLSKGTGVDVRHNIFHKATGSGKTMLMAADMLFLYSLGYRKFIFLTQSLNLIEKTKNNLLPDRNSSKLEFTKTITFEGKEVKIKEVEKFSDNTDDIEIAFKTVHSVHNDQIPKENSIDYSKQAIVILADEAHHFQASQKGKKDGDEKTWEDSINHILNANPDNRLYEFTATLELKHSEIHDKYKNKLIYDYPLLKFRKDGYSKEVELIRMPDIEQDRVLLALITSQFRMHLASLHNIPLVPRVFFKCQGTVEVIDQLKERVQKYIKLLDLEILQSLIKKYPQSKVLSLMASTLKTEKELDSFIKNLKNFMTEDSMISVHSKNSQKEKEKALRELNKIDELKHIRLVFAINILNEGWDVLSLYDIVKMDQINANQKETISEAQLIGRGARLFPYDQAGKDRYKRKFDGDHQHPLRLLEEMYFYSVNDNKYIEKLRESLIEIGLQDLEVDEVKDVKSIVSQRQKLAEMLSVKGRPKIFTNKLLALDEGIKDLPGYFKGNKTVITVQFDLNLGSESLLDAKVEGQSPLKSVLLSDLVKDNEFIFQRAVRKLDLINKGSNNYSDYAQLIKDLTHQSISNNILIEITDGVKGFNELNYDNKFSLALSILNKLSEYILKYKGKMYGSKVLDVESYIDETFKEYTKSERFCLDYKTWTVKEFHLNAKGDPLKDKYIINNPELFYYDKATWDSEVELKVYKFLDDNIPADQRHKFLIIRNENENYKVYSTDDNVDSEHLGQGFCPDFIILKRDGNVLIEYFLEVKGRTDTEEWKKSLLKTLLKGVEKESEGIIYRLEGIEEFYTGDASLLKKSTLLS
jgi:type III restriction enzyme